MELFPITTPSLTSFRRTVSHLPSTTEIRQRTLGCMRVAYFTLLVLLPHLLALPRHLVPNKSRKNYTCRQNCSCVSYDVIECPPPPPLIPQTLTASFATAGNICSSQELAPPWTGAAGASKGVVNREAISSSAVATKRAPGGQALVGLPGRSRQYPRI